ncbi:taurine ABC transporter ATP-binding protein [Burkholderia thailandensis]|uniref:Taurine import ATP-binding protein TauB n=2 Tax=Burkholderia thailandensis TaxID=57975 RepID=TAUB_BURTA|nr:ATP-binding cassette domain-containing protein [Burkholderia thailandensis]Q2T751.1 RecName: Full=Taurine import ATP-binding protein TauB [Burkholderia thailandensis E264]ABC33989.1 taurine ABC transporter, ATP-binding protein [Burkholderia thailandensis E264]AHI66866.1 ABC transporter family protein [Burkholderia thailandensis H0587]AHI74993.1 ABC transporter family protein [Burkholderia thailandensis 2002721723]AHI81489.1 ABC transporter family protein [Burkholderia thailandensis E444]AI
MAKLCAHQVSVVYASRRGALTALENVSMSVGGNEIVVALGASGCGKSTLLSLLAGFQPPTSGRVSVDGAPVTGPGADRGVVFQDDALMPWLNVIDNVAFGLRMQGVGRDARNARARDVLRLVKLAGFEQHRIDEISGGMRQRVGLARALAADPSFLLMDEPLGALDALTREHMQTLLLDVWRETGKGVFLITHSVEEAVLLATELLILSPRPGRIVARHSLDFARRYAAGESMRSIKSDPRFTEIHLALVEQLMRETEEV